MLIPILNISPTRPPSASGAFPILSIFDYIAAQLALMQFVRSAYPGQNSASGLSIIIHSGHSALASHASDAAAVIHHTLARRIHMPLRTATETRPGLQFYLVPLAPAHMRIN
ncbi:hypothetical protein ACGC1H_005217 [Rhizoctonia solani]